MRGKKLTIAVGTVAQPRPADDEIITSIQELKDWVRSGRLLAHVLRYREAALLVHSLDHVPKPLMISLILRLLSRGKCEFRDEQGRARRLTLPFFARVAGRFLRDAARAPFLLSSIRALLRDLSSQKATRRKLDLSATPIYLRTGLDFGLKAGGSIGHVAGVLNNLDSLCGAPVFLTTDPIPTVRPDIETHVIRPGGAFWDFRELPYFHFNNEFRGKALEILKSRDVGFIYQRYSLSNFAGVRLASEINVPLVTEYNGSEVWISRNWGTAVKYDALLEEIELLNVRAADLVVAVSDPLRDQLLEAGVSADRVLVNPNGVDPDKYVPDLDGAAARKKYGFGDKVVIAFIGTFGKWHGAEVLAEAFGLLLNKRPEYRDRARLLMIGDGLCMPLVKENLKKHNVEDCCVLTGLVPQEQGPDLLAAANVLASPHVPNPDGTPFFGSPTKLFEYMAMGRGIVASDLDQIGEILTHDKTAYMVPPGDADALADGLETLIDDPARARRLGENARREVVEKYTWKQHVRRIVERLGVLCR